MSVCNSCVRYSKQALAPTMSLVSLFCSSVVRLGSWVKSSSAKGTQKSFFFFAHHLVIASIEIIDAYLKLIHPDCFQNSILIIIVCFVISILFPLIKLFPGI